MFCAEDSIQVNIHIQGDSQLIEKTLVLYIPLKMESQKAVVKYLNFREKYV